MTRSTLASKGVNVLSKIMKNFVTPVMAKYMVFVTAFHAAVHLLPLEDSETLLAIYFSAIGVFMASAAYYGIIISQRMQKDIPAFETLSGLWISSVLFTAINVITVFSNWHVLRAGTLSVGLSENITTMLYSYAAWIFLVVAFEGSRK